MCLGCREKKIIENKKEKIIASGDDNKECCLAYYFLRSKSINAEFLSPNEFLLLCKENFLVFSSQSRKFRFKGNMNKKKLTERTKVIKSSCDKSIVECQKMTNKPCEN